MKYTEMSQGVKVRPVFGFEGKYTVNEYGEINSLPRTAKHNTPNNIRKVPEKKIAYWYNHRGYAMVSLHLDGKKIGIPVHIIVAKAFIPNPHNKPEVNHIDGIKTNNHYSNLEWNTRQENQTHSIEVLGKHHAGEAHYNAKLTCEQVIEMRRLFATGDYSKAEIGRMFGVHKNHAIKTISGKIWKTLKTV